MIVIISTLISCHPPSSFSSVILLTFHLSLNNLSCQCHSSLLSPFLFFLFFSSSFDPCYHHFIVFNISITVVPSLTNAISYYSYSYPPVSKSIQFFQQLATNLWCPNPSCPAHTILICVLESQICCYIARLSHSNT